MGLDITAVSKVELVAVLGDTSPNDADRYSEEGLQSTWLNPGFPGWENDRVAGYYRVAGRTGSAHWSYTGYNIWRAELCRVAFGVDPVEVWNDPEKYQDHALFRLIHFSDCEGTLGPETCSRILEGLRNIDPEELDPQIFGKYGPNLQETIELFEIGADDGFISFH